MTKKYKTAIVKYTHKKHRQWLTCQRQRSTVTFILPLLIVAFFISVHQLKKKQTSKHVKEKSQVLNDFN